MCDGVGVCSGMSHSEEACEIQETRNLCFVIGERNGFRVYSFFGHTVDFKSGEAQVTMQSLVRLRQTGMLTLFVSQFSHCPPNTVV